VGSDVLADAVVTELLEVVTSSPKVNDGVGARAHLQRHQLAHVGPHLVKRALLIGQIGQVGQNRSWRLAQVHRGLEGQLGGLGVALGEENFAFEKQETRLWMRLK
jgi:hypothetical protein